MANYTKGKEHSTYKHGFRDKKVYFVWSKMKTRCFNKNNKDYKHYGGRGITVCEQWLDPKIFCEWAMLNGYETNLEIDRINNDLGYYPENCKFITQQENKGVGKRRIYSNNTTGFVGVKFSKRYKKYEAQINKDKKIYYLGYYEKLEDAVLVRIEKEIELFGKQLTNFKQKD